MHRLGIKVPALVGGNCVFDQNDYPLFRGTVCHDLIRDAQIRCHAGGGGNAMVGGQTRDEQLTDAMAPQ